MDILIIAQAAPEIDTGDTAWMLAATALVAADDPGPGSSMPGSCA